MTRRIPDEFSGVVDFLEDDLSAALGDELVGIYLYGSLLEESFAPGRVASRIQNPA